jgi:hypothetical protein
VAFTWDAEAGVVRITTRRWLTLAGPAEVAEATRRYAVRYRPRHHDPERIVLRLVPDALRSLRRLRWAGADPMSLPATATWPASPGTAARPRRGGSSPAATPGLQRVPCSSRTTGRSRAVVGRLAA